MDKKELQRKVQAVEHQVTRLRRDNELMAAKLEGIEMAFALVKAKPPEPRGVGMEEDSVWALRCFSEGITEELPCVSKN